MKMLGDSGECGQREWGDSGAFTGQRGWAVGWLVCPRGPGGDTWGQSRFQALALGPAPPKGPELDRLVCGAVYAPGHF